jgi:hypothetical protein
MRRVIKLIVFIEGYSQWFWMSVVLITPYKMVKIKGVNSQNWSALFKPIGYWARFVRASILHLFTGMLYECK